MDSSQQTPVLNPLPERKWFLNPTKTDPERILVEPELVVMHNTITPFTRVLAGIYDFANRRWYHLKAERVNHR